MDDCRGQCYDGAGNMSGRLNGASSLIRAEHDKAIYVHCMNHMLNLCVADTCKLPLVRNMLDVARKLSEFLDNSPKRQHLISKIRVLMPIANHFVLVNVCRTRSIERIDGMDRIVELPYPVVATLEDIWKVNQKLRINFFMAWVLNFFWLFILFPLSLSISRSRSPKRRRKDKSRYRFLCCMRILTKWSENSSKTFPRIVKWRASPLRNYDVKIKLTIANAAK